MSVFNKFNYFSKALAEGGMFNLSTHAFKVAFTNTAPAPANTVLADLAEISYANCPPRDLTTVSATTTNGIYKLVLGDLTLAANGGDIAAFRYWVVYDNTTPNKQLVCWYDYGSSLIVHDTESMLIDFDGANGLLVV